MTVSCGTRLGLSLCVVEPASLIWESVVVLLSSSYVVYNLINFHGIWCNSHLAQLLKKVSLCSVLECHCWIAVDGSGQRRKTEQVIRHTRFPADKASCKKALLFAASKGNFTFLKTIANNFLAQLKTLALPISPTSTHKTSIDPFQTVTRYDQSPYLYSPSIREREKE